MRTILAVILFIALPFVSFLQGGTLSILGDADYYGYDLSTFEVYENDVKIGNFDKHGNFHYYVEYKGPIIIKHPDFKPIPLDHLSFSKKKYPKTISTEITPEGEEKIYAALVQEQQNTCTGSNKSNLERDSILPDSIAEFPGGMQEMKRFLAMNILYPQAAVELGIQGKVYFSFIVEADGSITCIEIKKGVDYFIDKEALRCVKSFPKFKPALLNGKPIPTIYLLPVSFKLN